MSNKLSLEERMNGIKSGSDVMFIKSVRDLYNAKALKVFKEDMNSKSFVVESVSAALGDSFDTLPPDDLHADVVSDMTFREFLSFYEKYIERVKDDEAWGAISVDRISLPLLALFMNLFNHINDCREIDNFMNLSYRKVAELIVDKRDSNSPILAEYLKRTEKSDNTTIRSVTRKIYNRAHDCWIPSSDINKYVGDIRKAIADLYYFGFGLLLCLSEVPDERLCID